MQYQPTGRKWAWREGCCFCHFYSLHEPRECGLVVCILLVAPGRGSLMRCVDMAPLGLRALGRDAAGANVVIGRFACFFVRVGSVKFVHWKGPGPWPGTMVATSRIFRTPLCRGDRGSGPQPAAPASRGSSPVLGKAGPADFKLGPASGLARGRCGARRAACPKPVSTMAGMGGSLAAPKASRPNPPLRRCEPLCAASLLAGSAHRRADFVAAAGSLIVRVRKLKWTSYQNHWYH
jgi:hypothetical protein